MNLSAREEDKNRIVESLNTIVQALMGNVVETIRTSVNELGADTERRIEALREETKGSLDGLRNELLAADESAKSEAITSVETRTNFLSEQTESRLESTRRDLDQKLEDVASRLQSENLSISERLDGVERGLAGHESTSGRIKEVLDSLGTVLTREKAPQEAATISPPSTSVSIGDSNPDHDGVVSNVKVTLGAPTNPAAIETQPVPVPGSDPAVTEDLEGALDRVDLHLEAPDKRHLPD